MQKGVQNKGAGPRWIARSESGESEEFPGQVQVQFRPSPRWNNLRSEPPKERSLATTRRLPRPHQAPPSTARCPFWKVAGTFGPVLEPRRRSSESRPEAPSGGDNPQRRLQGDRGRVRTKALCIRPNGGPAVANARYPRLSWPFYLLAVSCCWCLLLFCRVLVDGERPSGPFESGVQRSIWVAWHDKSPPTSSIALTLTSFHPQHTRQLGDHSKVQRHTALPGSRWSTIPVHRVSNGNNTLYY